MNDSSSSITSQAVSIDSSAERVRLRVGVVFYLAVGLAFALAVWVLTCYIVDFLILFERNVDWISLFFLVLMFAGILAAFMCYRCAIQIRSNLRTLHLMRRP